MSARELVILRDHCRRKADEVARDIASCLDLVEAKVLPAHAVESKRRERALWTQIGDEIDAYLHDPAQPAPDDRPLFETETP